MTEPAPTPPEWATLADVYAALGKFGDKVKAATEGDRFDTEAQLGAAHAEALAYLTRLYGADRLPTPPDGSPAVTVVRYAVARLAAANILDILRAALPDVSELPERLRRTAWDTLSNGLPGYPPGGGPDSPTTSSDPWASAGGVSQFADPYRVYPYPDGVGHYDGRTNTWTL